MPVTHAHSISVSLPATLGELIDAAAISHAPPDAAISLDTHSVGYGVSEHDEHTICITWTS